MRSESYGSLIQVTAKGADEKLCNSAAILYSRVYESVHQRWDAFVFLQEINHGSAGMECCITSKSSQEIWSIAGILGNERREMVQNLKRVSAKSSSVRRT